MLYGLEKMGIARYEFTPACKVAVEDAFTPQGLELFTTACAAEGPRCDGFLADLDAHTRGQVCDLQLPSAQDVCGGGRRLRSVEERAEGRRALRGGR